MAIEIVVRSQLPEPLKKVVPNQKILKVAKKLLSDLECSEAELSIAFISDAEILELNSSYRNKVSATDVLSFSQAPLLLGDIVISLETAQRQAQELGHGMYYEVIRLLVHGVLHLNGYEHEDVDNSVSEEMFSKERELMAMLETERLLD
ncbi:UNVERIFIED_CONTAM: hypothetical protein GTU68_065078 [Idotea baltica]|nr:hypothetical protein [Idotea baltica]